MNRAFFSASHPLAVTPPRLSLRDIPHQGTSVFPGCHVNHLRHLVMEDGMNDYRTTILFDLRRAVRSVPAADHERTRLLYDNIGFWLRAVPDVVEQKRWMELFTMELALSIPGLHEDYCRAAVKGWVAESKAEA